jgi:hypothetical protein
MRERRRRVKGMRNHGLRGVPLTLRDSVLRTLDPPSHRPRVVWRPKSGAGGLPLQGHRSNPTGSVSAGRLRPCSPFLEVRHESFVV